MNSICSVRHACSILTILLLLPLIALLCGCQSETTLPPIETVGLPAENAQKQGEENGFKYTHYVTYASVVGYSGKDAIVTVPESLGGLPVKQIGENAFEGSETLTEITIPASVILIDRFAFEGCKKLQTVHLSEGLETIGAYAFRHAGLASINLPDTLCHIGREAFMATNLTEITLPDSVSLVDEYAFHACPALSSVTLSRRMTSLANRLFEGCGSLRELIVPAHITAIGDYTFANCKSLTTLVIPDSVTAIGTGAFVGNASMQIITSSEDSAAAIWCKRNGLTATIATEEQWLTYYPKEES